ncbi:DUF305 domain-containing protein [Nonomuraea sp. NPDC049129]|uniref:DUF305 domain-containing protein n=1 Tax=Nonomuraea sp. NPDC049129 TaxID=3155272 RepID=UPI0033D05FB7
MTVAHRITMLTVAGIGAVALLTACGSSTPTTTAAGAGAAPAASSNDGASADVTNMDGMDMSSSKPKADFNDGDVMFVQMMLPHHQEALRMAKWAQTNASNAKVKDLAMKMQMEAQPQLSKLNNWLTAWDKEPMADDDPMMTSTPGMMSSAEMAKMRQMKGGMFDRMFTQMMISHHQGAIKVTQNEIARGSNAKTKTMAKTIQTSLRSELAELKQLLPTL